MRAPLGARDPPRYELIDPLLQWKNNRNGNDTGRTTPELWFHLFVLARLLS